jgi:hypothetical protein
MASSIIQSAASNSAVANPTVTLGATPTPGNTLVAWVSSDTTHTAVPTAGAGRSFTQRIAQVNNQGFYVWTRLVTSGDSATVTFTASSALNTSAHVIEVQGTYDVIGTGLSTINAGAASRTTNGLTPTNADNAVLAIAGIHGFTATGSGGSADNTFTLTEANFPAGTGTATAGGITTQKFTGSTAATGTTTISWTGSAIDRDGVQIAFTGIGGGAAVVLPEMAMAPIRR